MNEGLWPERAESAETFASGLEARALQITRRGGAGQGDESVQRVLVSEIALVLNQIKQTRDVHARQLRSLLRVECYVGTELIQMESRTPRYSPYRFPEREKLQRRLASIEGERRKMAMDHTDQLAKLHDRLLISLNRHAQLVP